MALDEVSLRKPEFVEGVRVKLGDGQDWSFPRPRLRLVPRKFEDGDIGLATRPVYPAERQADLDIILAEIGEGDEAFWRWLEARSRLATRLLLDNYDLDNNALAELLPIDFADDANRDIWLGVSAAMRGHGAPKPSAAG